VNFLGVLIKIDKNSVNFLLLEKKGKGLLIILEGIPLKPYDSHQGLRIGSYDRFWARV